VLSRRQSIASGESRVDLAEARLARLQIDIDDAERALKDTEVRANFAGTLSETSVVRGGVVNAGERVATLIDTSDLEVVFRVSTSQYARLLDDDGALIPAPVSVALDVHGTDLATTGRITRESAEVGEGVTGRLLFAELEATKGFRAGDFVTVRVQEPPIPFVVRVPATAVSAAGAVLVVGDDDRLEEVTVEVLRRQDDDVLIRARGLGGREIVAERSPLIGSGIKVRPIRPSAGDAAPAPPAMVELSEERRARLLAFVEGNSRMPEEVKTRLLSQLKEVRVPAEMVQRLESRIGG
jgi:RND family efflux transporter MFP subunit